MKIYEGGGAESAPRSDRVKLIFGISTVGSCSFWHSNERSDFFLNCQQFDLIRTDLFGQLSELPALDLNDMNTKALCRLLLYGSPYLNIITNRMIMDATILYIKATQRFQ